MKKKSLLTVILSLFFKFTSYGTGIIINVTNPGDLQSAVNTAGASDIIQILNDIDVSSLTLPLLVQPGVIIQGNYDLLSIPNSNGTTYSNIYEDNEKQINGAYLQVIYKDHLELLPNFSGQILSIAAQCPLSGGPAVYKARTLALLIDPNLQYDDQLACSQAGVSWRTSQHTVESSISISPNPAGDNATIKYNILTDAALLIYNQVGEVVHFEDVLKDSQSALLNLVSFKNGIYTCRLIQEGKVDIAQLIVIH